jgi:molybdate transport system substrate-binding protein
MRCLARALLFAVLGGLAVLLLRAPAASAEELTLSVAISTKEAMEAVGRIFTRDHPGTTPRFNFGSSGALEKQIEAGAPVDLFVSAGERQMDALERLGLIRAETRRVFARNVLTVIKPADSRLDLARPDTLLHPSVRRIVIGNPKTVPVGQYALQSLKALGLWSALQSKLVMAENVRQALEYVARAEVDAGFVYTTDVATRPDRVKEAFRPPEDTYSPIVYPVAVVKESRRLELAKDFISLLVGSEGQTVLARLGFQPAPPLPQR